MTATIGRRRLDMTADRIEAYCAEHKITAQVSPSRAGRHSALFRMTVEGSASAKVLTLAGELGLSLGVPVIVHACGPRTLRVRVFGL